MLGVKQIDEPITPEYLSVLKEQYEQVTGGVFEEIIKNSSKTSL